MTLVKTIAFPNSPLTAYEVDPEQWDTETVSGATGETFRNGRRTVPIWYCKLTLQDTFGSAAVAAALAVKSAAEGRLYGFQFTCPEDGVTRDVVFRQDSWTLKILSGTTPDTITNARTSIDVELGGSHRRCCRAVRVVPSALGTRLATGSSKACWCYAITAKTAPSCASRKAMQRRHSTATSIPLSGDARGHGCLWPRRAAQRH
jgi:hypothetical protein